MPHVTAAGTTTNQGTPAPQQHRRHPIGPDVDLKRDDVRLKDGTRLTDKVADRRGQSGS